MWKKWIDFYKIIQDFNFQRSLRTAQSTHWICGKSAAEREDLRSEGHKYLWHRSGGIKDTVEQLLETETTDYVKKLERMIIFINEIYQRYLTLAKAEGLTAELPVVANKMEEIMLKVFTFIKEKSEEMLPQILSKNIYKFFEMFL